MNRLQEVKKRSGGKKNHTTATISVSTLARLNSLKYATGAKTIDEAINKALDIAERKN